jgi:hypothetical protein
MASLAKKLWAMWALSAFLFLLLGVPLTYAERM